MAYPNNYGGGYPQQQQAPQGQPQAAGGFNPWKPGQGGGGLDEYILTVEECKPGSSKQDPTKQNLEWAGKNHEGKPANKAWSIGKEWRFDWNQQPPRYVDDKNPQRQVNENTTMGVLLRCIVEGVPYDLRNAAQALQSRPGGPLSPAAWQGSRWHMCKVEMDFGQGPRAVIWPIAFLGFSNEPMPQVQWRTPNHSSGQAGLHANPPAPNGQMQPGPGHPGQQGYPPQQGQPFPGQGAPPMGMQPAGQYLQQQGHPQYPPQQQVPQQQVPQQQAYNMSAAPQYPPQGQPGYPPQGQPQGYAPQGQPGQPGYPPQGGGYPQGPGQFHG